MVSRIKQLWHREQDLQSAASLLVVTMLLSNVLGFLRDLILANTVPLAVLDTYYTAFRVPDFLFNLFILGAISSAFIPVFLDLKTSTDSSTAWHLTNNLITSALILLAGLGVGLYWLMPQMISVFVPGFHHAAPIAIASGKLVGSIDLTTSLARVMLLSPLFFAVSYIMGGVLNANKKFFAYALAPLVYNVSIIIGGLLTPIWGIYGVTWAVVIGAFLHASVQIPTVRKLGYRYSFVFQPKDAGIRRVVRLMVPRSISLGMSQLILLVFTSIGSRLPSGAISIYTLTNNFQTTPVAVFAASIATAVFPMLGKASSEGNTEQYRQLLTESLKGMFFFMIPSTAILFVVRAHIIRLYLALNHQTWGDTIRAIDTFTWFILALAVQGFSIIMIRAFYALQDTRRPMFVAILGGLVSVGAAVFFTRLRPDVPSLSLGFSFGAILEAVVLAVVFRYAYPGLMSFKSVGETIATTALLAIVSALAARITLSVVSDGAFLPVAGLGTSRIVPLAIALVAAGVVGLGSYLGMARLLKRSELTWLWPKRAARSVLLPDSEALAGGEGLV